MIFKRIRVQKFNKVVLVVLPLVFSLLVLALVSACAPRSATLAQGALHSDFAVEWYSTVDCNVCHGTETKSGMDPAILYGYILSLPEGAGLVCVDCHDDATVLKTVHESVTADPSNIRLQLTSVDEVACIPCHVKAELAEKTAESTVLIDNYNPERVVNPHNIPLVNTFGETIKDHVIPCANCHKVHEPLADRNENAFQVCLSCHHQYLWECNTCHAAS